MKIVLLAGFFVLFIIFYCCNAQRSYKITKSIKAALFLPSSINVDKRCREKHQNRCQNYLATLENVRPVLDLAVRNVHNESRDIFPKEWLTIYEFAVDCRNQTTAAYRFLEAKDKYNISVIFGPVCDYPVAAIVRMSGYYRLPFLTPGAFSHSFEDKNDFPLTRLGLSYGTMYNIIDNIASLFNWKRFVYGYQLDFDESEVLSQDFCKLLGNGVYERMGSRFAIDFKSVQRHEQLELERWLVNEVGNRFAVIVICGSPNIVRDIMLTAHKLGMTQSGEYVFVNIDVSVGANATKPWHRKNDTDAINDKARDAFRAMKVISLRKSQRPEYEEFEKKVRDTAETKYNYSITTGKPYELNHFISAFYEAVLLYSIAVNETLAAHKNTTNGFEITQRMWNRTFEGITGKVSINENGDRHVDYALFDYNPDAQQFEEKAYWSGADDKWVQVGNWYWVGGSAPKDTPVCGYDKSKCPKKDLPAWGWSLIALGLVTLSFAIISYFIHRHYKLEAELSAMTWRIRWDELSNPRKKSEKPNLDNDWAFRNNHTGECELARCDSMTSLAKSIVSEETIVPTEQIFTKTAAYKGTIVALKKLNITKQKIETNRAMLLELKKMKDLQHDHITRFVGACIDPPHFCIVTEYCPKGSLEDILENEEIRLDKMMIYSLMHDIVKGMDYIHSSDIRSHGNLKSSNCVVDSRFVVKVTDFGLHILRSLEDKSSDSHDSHHYWKSKLWTAPELLRMDKPDVGGTQKGDVYSFSIILHEMAFRQGVFYLDNETATPQDIVNRVMLHQQPPFRPSIDDANADESLVQLMTKCWAENPLDRPDFSFIRKQVRMLNKKFDTSTNIVDNLLKRMEQYATNLEGLVEERTAAYLEEKRKAENLLYQLLPQSVAAELIQGKPVTAEAFDSVTIYFSDIVGFTSLCSSSTPMQVVTLLSDLYTCFDNVIEHFDVYKVETIGDAYMVVSGLPRRNGTKHAYEIARMSLALLAHVNTFRIRHRPDDKLNLRIGLHSGPVCAGVVGLKMPRYCLFGDTVNTASRMESNGLPLKIHVSNTTKEYLDTFGCFQLELRGEVEMKGKGMQTTWWLTDEKPITSSPGSLLALQDLKPSSVPNSL